MGKRTAVLGLFAGTGMVFSGPFIDWLFAMHPLRRIRIETPHWNLEHLGGLVEHGFASIEGRLVEERFVNGAYVDVVLMAITRERWGERRHLVVPR